MARDELSADDVRQRMSRQLPLPQKSARADFVVDNSGSREQTLLRAGEVLTQVCAKLGVSPPSANENSTHDNSANKPGSG